MYPKDQEEKHHQKERRRLKILARLRRMELEAAAEVDGLMPRVSTVVSVALVFLGLIVLLVVVRHLIVKAELETTTQQGTDGASEKRILNIDGELSREKSYILPDMVEVVAWGQYGRGVRVDMRKLSPFHVDEYFAGYKEFAFNKYLSDRISMNRRLPDVREPACNQTAGQEIALTASVIIVVDNEPWTTLMRTVYSVVERSPPALLKEIILVDDGSTADVLRYPKLERYTSVIDKVRIIRLPDPMGLAKARWQGVLKMSGDVAIFLHSRCECTEGWLPPLMHRIQQDTKTVAVPVVDRIDYHTFEYITENMNRTTVGSFTWDLRTTKRQVKNPPISVDVKLPNPIIADGIFAVHKKILATIGGYYDALTGMDTLHIEFSFRTWMCGGRIELVLCSHVGYLATNKTSVAELELDPSYSSERKRIAHLWMDDYSQFVYEHMQTPNQKLFHGDEGISSNIQRNHCGNFIWFLENVEPNLQVHGDIVRRGKLTQVAINETVLMLAALTDDALQLIDWYIRPTTIWYLMKSGQLKLYNNKCLVAKQFIPDKLPSKEHLPNRKDSFSEFHVSKPETDFFQSFLDKALPVQFRSPTGKIQRNKLNKSLTRFDLTLTEVKRNKRSYFNDPEPAGEEAKSGDLKDQENYLNYNTQTYLTQLSRNNFLNDKNSNKNIPADIKLMTNERLKFEAQTETSFNVLKLLLKHKKSLLGPSSMHSLHLKDDFVEKHDVEIDECVSKHAQGNHWMFTKAGNLLHVGTQLCLTIQSSFLNLKSLVLRECEPYQHSQIWQFI